MHLNIKILLILLFLTSCGVEKQNLQDSDPIFRNEDNIVVNSKLKNQNINVSYSTKLDNWNYADYYSEISNINHYFANEFKVHEKISFGFPSKNKYSQTSMPIIINDVMYVCSGLGSLVAFDLNTNKEIWSKTMYSLGRKLSSFASFLTAHLSYGDDKIFIASNDGFIIAVDINSHEAVWIKNLEHPLRSTFKYSDGVLYGVSASNKVFALNAKNGEIIWKYDHTDTQKVTISKPSILILDDKIIAAFSTAEALALSKENGKILWGSEVNYKDGDNMFRMIDIDITPAKVGEYVMVGGINGNVQFIRPENGQVVSGYFGSLASAIVNIDDFVFFMDSDSRLICLHVPTGGVKWSTEFQNKKTLPVPAYLNAGNNKINVGFEYGGPILIDGKIILLNQFGDFFIINPQSGDIEKTIKIPSDIHKNPIVVNGKIYMIDDSFGYVLVI